MYKILNKIYHETLFGRVLIYFFHSTKDRLFSDRAHILFTYKKIFGVYPNLKNPKSLNEKILWLKLNDRTSLHTQCADKFLVRDFIKQKIGEEYLVPLLFHTKNPEDINENNLPENTPLIIKTNHDSGGGFFVYNIKSINWTSLRENLKKRLSKNYYQQSKEWQYKNIEPRIIVEKLLQDKNGNIPFDYKLHCFNGKVRMISVDMGRGTDQHYRNWYTTSWEREKFKWSSPKENGKNTDPSDEDLEKPMNLDQMINLAEKLASSFIYVRVDLYDVDGKLYFGELTFHHDGGYRPIFPKEWDLKLGKQLNLK
ncbi:TupA-like ATPgrasp [Maribacter orientalis]|uniref:TupA-like ATPgrasp n=1 Tax=Maribacter orientalis TaxID=228957 RepID=A0A1H7SHF1_9FLAO|nr:ATP-grasp fold amidoligase family protein [Maribacter orientalis]SEL71923.1 TupA-like ATPgrasp [Maribacter orientalis]